MTLKLLPTQAYEAHKQVSENYVISEAVLTSFYVETSRGRTAANGCRVRGPASLGSTRCSSATPPRSLKVYCD